MTEDGVKDSVGIYSQFQDDNIRLIPVLRPRTLEISQAVCFTSCKYKENSRRSWLYRGTKMEFTRHRAKTMRA